MAYTCNFCGTYVSGWKCSTCEQTELLKKSTEQQRQFAEQQNDLMERSRRDAAYEARMNREMQEEQAERAERKARAAQMEAELESWIKQIFAEVALLIQTNTTETVGQKVEEFINKANAELSSETYETTGGIFTPKFASYFRNNLTDYILNNPAKAAEIAIAKQIFESHAKTAKEIWNANEAREAENRRIEEEQEKAEQAIKDADAAAIEVVDLEKKKKARYGCLFFVFLGVIVSYIEFSDGNLLRGLLCVLGVIFFGFLAWALKPDVTQEDIDSVVGGFVKGLNR